MRPIRKFILLVMFVFVSFSAFAFEKGFTLGLKANFSGSFTDPHINEADKRYLGADFMRGMVGFIMNGDAELTYIFDSIRYFNYTNNKIFGGLGLGFNLGIGQGFSGQISGSKQQTFKGSGGANYKKDIEIYARVYMMPVLQFGTTLKTLLLKNRLVLGFGIGGKLLADPQPIYELYSNLNDYEIDQLKANGIDFSSERGTLYVSETMMTKMNPLGVSLKGSMEYNQPIISTMGLIIGGYLSYSIYKPGYVAMPKKIEDAARKQNANVNFQRDPIKSFFMNTLDFGVSLGLLFKV